MTRFASQWQANEKFVWAAEYAKSEEYAYRKLWNIPRHDPRLENMTLEEFEFEVLTNIQYQLMKAGKLPLTEHPEEWKETAKKQIEKIMQAEAVREAEEVDPEEVF